MGKAVMKERILEDAGYFYSIERSMYINRKARKGFSVQFAQDHSEAELEACIKEPGPPADEWRFYFNTPPSEAVKRELSAILA